MHQTRIRAIAKQRARTGHKVSDAEKQLWKLLRTDEIGRYKFRRQHALGNYVLDFVCLEAGLVLEIENGHGTEFSTIDEAKAQWLHARGLQVMRFWNDEILNNIEGVKRAIWNHLSSFPPSPSGVRGAAMGYGDR